MVIPFMDKYRFPIVLRRFLTRGAQSTLMGDFTIDSIAIYINHTLREWEKHDR